MLERTPLVGRGAELDRLDGVLDGTAEGHEGTPCVVDLTGAAGIGKSRLLTEVCGRARARGLTVLRGRATEYERHIPFRLFTDALADLDPRLLRPWSTDPSLNPVLHGAHLGLPTQRASALRSAGQLLAGRGEPGAAAELYLRAAAEAARSGATLWESQALLIGSSLTAQSGDTTGAAPLWHRGRRLAETGGARLLTGLADLFPPLPPTGTPAPAITPGPLPHLTPRERQIAGLVAEGLTTPAIAARLYLSPRTVDTHLSHIYRKTGVTTRSALAALTARATP